MTRVEIEALEQNASSVVADAAAGEIITITDHGRPVAQITPIPRPSLQRLIDSDRARPPRRSIHDLPPPQPGPSLTDELERMRQTGQY